MERVRALVAHETPDDPPLRLRSGDLVRVGDRHTDWPAFVFITAEGGTGWVPARHLSEDRGEAVTITEYDTTELETSVGEALEALRRDEQSGWVWCRARDGREGWVPIRTLAPIR